MGRNLIILSLTFLYFCNACAQLPEKSRVKASPSHKPGACTDEPEMASIPTLNIACRNPNINPELSRYCLESYKTKLDVLSVDCQSDFEALAGLRKGLTTLIVNSTKNQLKLTDPTQKDLLDPNDFTIASGYIQQWLSDFSLVFFTKKSENQYVASIEGVLSQINSLIDQKIQNTVLKDKTKLRQETSFKYQVLALESALTTYSPNYSSHLFLDSRLASTLNAAYAQIEALSRVHDLACSFESCAGREAESNVVNLILLLGGLDDPELSRLADATLQKLSQGSDFYKLAQLLKTNASIVNNLVNDASSQDSGLYQKELKKIAQSFQLMKNRFEKEGFFRDAESHFLSYGFSEDARDHVKGLLRSLKTSLLTDKVEYNAAVERHFQELQSLNASEAELAKTKVSFEGFIRDFASHNLDIIGLVEANRNDENSLARYAEQMARVLESNRDLANSFVSQPAFAGVLTIKGSC